MNERTNKRTMKITWLCSNYQANSL